MREIPLDKLIVRDSMLLSFRGSEFWGIELDALSTHTELVRQKLRKDMAYALRPSTPGAVAIHLRDTLVSEELANEIVSLLAEGSGKLRRVALVGLDRKGKQLLQKRIPLQKGYLCSFFDDYEKAKEWLIPNP